MCSVHVTGGSCPQPEVEAYIARGRELYGRTPDSIDIAWMANMSSLRIISRTSLSTAFAGSPVIWWARWIDSTTQSAPKSGTASSTASPFSKGPLQKESFCEEGFIRRLVKAMRPPTFPHARLRAVDGGSF